MVPKDDGANSSGLQSVTNPNPPHFPSNSFENTIQKPNISNPALLELENRISNDQDKSLWNTTEESKKSPDSRKHLRSFLIYFNLLVVMFREMLLFRLDRDCVEDYPKYFEMKQKLELHANTMNMLILYEMQTMGLVPNTTTTLSAIDLELYHNIKAKMAQHSNEQNEWIKCEMPILQLSATSLLDRIEYYGIKADIASGTEDERI